jgi:single-stranded-DNA-specific exonuclease
VGTWHCRLRQAKTERRAIAWRWDPASHVPDQCDVAYRISVNRWQGEQRLQLELKAIRMHSDSVMLQRGLKKLCGEADFKLNIHPHQQ